MRCYSHLSDDEREQIGLAKAVGHSIGAIAKAIGRPKSTVSRELSRNKLPSGRYSPLHAAGAYQLRRRREARIERDRALRYRSHSPSQFQFFPVKPSKYLLRSARNAPSGRNLCCTSSTTGEEGRSRLMSR
jgi:IS30 family transposase